MHEVGSIIRIYHDALSPERQISRHILLLRSVADKICRENQNIRFMFNYFFLNRAVYEIMWKNIVEPGRAQMTV